jgi:hypothetical protein
MSYTVQSVVIPKKSYTLEDAEKKVLKLGYKDKYTGKRVNQYKAGQTINFWRFRQINPNKFDKDTFRVKKINDINLIIGILK